MSTSIIQQGPAYELSVRIAPTRYGHHLSLISFVPIARQAEPQVRFQTILSREELKALHDAIGHALRDGVLPEGLSGGTPDAALAHSNEEGRQVPMDYPPVSECHSSNG